MERLSDLMERLGFNEEASESSKAAFIQSMIKRAYNIDAPLPARYEIMAKIEKAADSHVWDVKVGEQLAFNLDSGDADMAAKKENVG